MENLVGYAQRDLVVPLLTDAALGGGGVVGVPAANAAARVSCAEVNAATHSEISAIPNVRLVEEVRVVIDCCTKECIGYAIADHMRADLVCDALAMAARNYPLAEKAIFHSDYAEPCGLVLILHSDN